MDNFYAADFSDQLMEDVNYKPETTVPEGIRRFVAWYRDYYAVEG